MNKEKISQRLKAEMNDLKRTPDSVATELDVPIKEVKSFLDGDFRLSDYLEFIIKFTKIYPVDISDLLIDIDDTKNGILHFNIKDSMESSRVFSRQDKEGNFTPYYEYRDTASSKIAYFYPEWISQLRVVSDDDPYNLDVAYNRGHFLHQYTLFVGPVNFYYEVDGIKYCKKMNTGDSMYITPYIKHSFTSRDSSKTAYIIAVTSGGYVKHSLHKFHNFGTNFLTNSKLNIHSFSNRLKKIVEIAANNELRDINSINLELKNKGIKKTLSDFYENNNINVNDIHILSEVLNIDPSDLLFPEKYSKEKVSITKFNPNQYEFYPNKEDPAYRIYRLQKVSNVEGMKGFIINPLSSKNKIYFEFSLNIYMINYEESEITVSWINDSKNYSINLKKGESLYIKPFIKFSLTSIKKDSMVFVNTILSGISTTTMKELSFFEDSQRIISDNNTWFKNKKDE